MGEAKRKKLTDHAPVWVLDPTDPKLAKARKLGAELLALSRDINAGVGEHKMSTALSLAFQVIVQANVPGLNRNDVLNGLSKATAWAIHPSIHCNGSECSRR